MYVTFCAGVIFKKIFYVNKRNWESVSNTLTHEKLTLVCVTYCILWKSDDFEIHVQSTPVVKSISWSHESRICFVFLCFAVLFTTTLFLSERGDLASLSDFVITRVDYSYCKVVVLRCFWCCDIMRGLRRKCWEKSGTLLEAHFYEQKTEQKLFTPRKEHWPGCL